MTCSACLNIFIYLNASPKITEIRNNSNINETILPRMSYYLILFTSVKNASFRAQ